jgi:hypothetical protein
MKDTERRRYRIVRNSILGAAGFAVTGGLMTAYGYFSRDNDLYMVLGPVVAGGGAIGSLVIGGFRDFNAAQEQRRIDERQENRR